MNADRDPGMSLTQDIELSEAEADAARSDAEEVLQPIPESIRTKKLAGQFWIWAGANVAPINWILGALGIHLGLGFADTITVLVIGNMIGMFGFGFFVLLGQKTGATGMLLSRGAFGRRGAYLPAAIQATIAICWSAINTWVILDLVVALFGMIGWVDPSQPNIPWRIGIAAVIMAIQVAICYRGYSAISKFERWTMPPTIIVLIAMSIIAWGFLDIDWGYQGPPGEILHGLPRIAAMSGIMTAIGIGWGIGWYTYAPDYSRFVSRTVKPIKLYFVSVLGQFLPVVWLGVLGASLATKNGQADPGELIVSSFGTLAIPVILLVIHGPIATNIINLYTFGVAVQSLDIKVSRKKVSLIVGALSMCAVVAFIYASDFAQLLDSFLGGIVAWVATWGGIMAVHYFVFERRHKNFSYLFRAPNDTSLKPFNVPAFIAFFIGLFCTWLCMYGAIPVFQGPIAKALGGIDFSWLAGTTVAGGLYFILGWSRYRDRILAGVPLGVRPDRTDHQVQARHGDMTEDILPEQQIEKLSDPVEPDAVSAENERRLLTGEMPVVLVDVDENGEVIEPAASAPERAADGGSRAASADADGKTPPAPSAD